MENANGVIKKLTSAERSYYTAAEVREMMGVSRDTAYRMIRSLRSDLIADGQLANWSNAGRWYANLNNGLGNSWWNYAARISVRILMCSVFRCPLRQP